MPSKGREKELSKLWDSKSAFVNDISEEGEALSSTKQELQAAFVSKRNKAKLAMVILFYISVTCFLPENDIFTLSLLYY